MPQPLQDKLILLADQLITHSLKLGTAESCTGGGLSFMLTSLPGSAAWFERGLVTYSNRAKRELLGVQESTLIKHGAVSQETAEEMVEGLLMRHPVNIGVGITGVAGPEGLETKPVGTVWIACKKQKEKPLVSAFHFAGNRENIRHSSIEAAIDLLLSLNSR